MDGQCKSTGQGQHSNNRETSGKMDVPYDKFEGVLIESAGHSESNSKNGGSNGITEEPVDNTTEASNDAELNDGQKIEEACTGITGVSQIGDDLSCKETINRNNANTSDQDVQFKQSTQSDRISDSQREGQGGGNSPVEAKLADRDRGNIPVDTKLEGRDGGTSFVDAKLEGWDGGKSPVDTNPEGQDGGNSSVDAKLEGQDGGKSPVDTKPEGQDGGNSSVDAKPVGRDGGTSSVDAKLEGRDGGKSPVGVKQEKSQDRGNYTECQSASLLESEKTKGLTQPTDNMEENGSAERGHSHLLKSTESQKECLPKGKHNLGAKLGGEENGAGRCSEAIVESGTLKETIGKHEQTIRDKDKQLEERATQLDTQLQKNETLQTLLHDTTKKLEETIEKHEQTIRDQEKHLEERATQLDTQLQKSENLQTRLHEITKKSEEKERKLVDCEAEIATLCKDWKQLKDQYAEIQYKNGSLRDAILKEKDVNKQHQGQEKKLGETIRGLNQENQKLKDELNNLNKEMKKKEKTAQDKYKDMETKFLTAATKQDAIIVGLKKDAKELQRKADRETENCQKTSKAYYELMDRTRDLEEYVKGIANVHVEKEQLKTEIDFKTETIQSWERDARTLQEENKRLSDSLSKEWSTKVSSDETNTENISVSNRPMNIRTEYENMCSDEWLEAKTELDELQAMDEDQRRMFLCDVLMRAEKCASKYYEDRMSSLTHFLSQPLTHMVVSVSEHTDGSRQPQEKPQSPSNIPSYSKEQRPSEETLDPKCEATGSLPMELKNALGDFLRSSADKTDITHLIMDLSAQLTTEWEKSFSTIDSALENVCMKKYICKCSLLAWKMITQRPQMNFSNEGLFMKHNEKTQEPNFGSDDPKHENATVMYYVHPALYHSSNLLVKGRVVIKIVN